MLHAPEELLSVLSSLSPLSPPGAIPSQEGDVTPHAPSPECPICLEGPSAPPGDVDAFLPCCAAFAHLCCIQQCAHRHGQCPSCRQNICGTTGPSPHGVNRRACACRRLPLTGPRPLVRTFSRADVPEPEEPRHVRASWRQFYGTPSV